MSQSVLSFKASPPPQGAPQSPVPLSLRASIGSCSRPRAHMNCDTSYPYSLSSSSCLARVSGSSESSIVIDCAA